MKILRALFVLGSALLLVSCTGFLPPLVSWARFAPPVTPSFQLNTNRAVIYGRFGNKLDLAAGNQLALRIRNESSRQDYLICLKEKDPVYGIAVEPGIYRVAGFVATFFDHRTAGERSFKDTPLFEVRSNSVVYLGDFAGHTVGFVTQQWSIPGITNNFSETTEEFLKKYPNLASVSAISATDAQIK